MTRIDDYLNDLGKALGHMARDERDAVLAEVHDHLTQEAARLQDDDPSVGDDAAATRAIDAFGPADEIGVAYGGDDGSVRLINQETGEKILEGVKVTGRVAGKVAVTGLRGLGSVLKYTTFAVLILLGIGTIIAVAALFFAGDVIDTFQDDIRESVPRPLYGNQQSWSGGEGHTEAYTEYFDVRDGVKEFWIDMALNAESGCGTMKLIDPSGDERYDSGAVCGDSYESRSFNFAEKGQWTIEYAFVNYEGYVDVEAWYFEDASA